MPVLALDLGGTKLAVAVFTDDGQFTREEKLTLESRKGAAIGTLIREQIQKYVREEPSIGAVGICVPGIYYSQKGSVWAPNIPEWENYPILQEIQTITRLPVKIDSDRTCYILGEKWKGAVQQCNQAIYIAVGTGIGAGLLVEGQVLRGACGIAGSIGWMVLQKPGRPNNKESQHLESSASGEGIARQIKEAIALSENYTGRWQGIKKITAAEVFQAYDEGDSLAVKVIENCIALWGMVVANMVSVFNPEKIIFGGGVFGPAIKFIPDIVTEARKWAHPVSIQQVSVEPSALGVRAGLFGAASLALHELQKSKHL